MISNDPYDCAPYSDEYPFIVNNNFFNPCSSTNYKSTMNITNNPALSIDQYSKSLLASIDLHNNRALTESNDERNSKHSTLKSRANKRNARTQTYLANKSLLKKKQYKNNQSSQQICWFSMNNPWLKRVAYVQNNDINLDTNNLKQILYT